MQPAYRGRALCSTTFHGLRLYSFHTQVCTSMHVPNAKIRTLSSPAQQAFKCQGCCGKAWCERTLNAKTASHKPRNKVVVTAPCRGGATSTHKVSMLSRPALSKHAARSFVSSSLSLQVLKSLRPNAGRASLQGLRSKAAWRSNTIHYTMATHSLAIYLDCVRPSRLHTVVTRFLVDNTCATW